jgi:hypothetical protein
MISTQAAITRTRRDLTLGAILRWVLVLAGALALFGQPLFGSGELTVLGLIVVVTAIWLMFNSVRGSRIAAESSSLIAAGQYELAEEQIAAAVRSFSIFRTAKLLVLHHLAMLRHAQNRWQESALLCRAVLTQRPAPASGLDRSSRLILAESLLELGDLAGVYENLSALYSQRLSLREALNLLVVQMEYLARIGAWDQMTTELARRTEMAELLPTAPSARVQALLALAAKKTGRPQWANWLRGRAELLVEPQKLTASQPILTELWKEMPNVE